MSNEPAGFTFNINVSNLTRRDDWTRETIEHALQEQVWSITEEHSCENTPPPGKSVARKSLANQTSMHANLVWNWIRKGTIKSNKLRNWSNRITNNNNASSWTENGLRNELCKRHTYKWYARFYELGMQSENRRIIIQLGTISTEIINYQHDVIES